MFSHTCQELSPLAEPLVVCEETQPFPFSIGDTYSGVLGADVVTVKILHVTEDLVRFRFVWDMSTSGQYAGLTPNRVLSNKVHEVPWQTVLDQGMFQEEGYTFWA